MHHRQWQDNPQGLEPLARQARSFARHMMRTAGSVPPTVIADTEDGYIFCMPTTLTSDADKDRLADFARLLSIAYSARAIVIVAEAWGTVPDAKGKLDTETPPSQSPTRREIVVLFLEDHSRKTACMLPIQRNAAGQFIELDELGPLQFGESTGRFSGIMPREAPNAEEAAEAKAALQHFGLNVVNRGFDPNLN